MNVIPNASATAASLDRLLIELRPRLHRYCARMVGSVIDGEDVVQDALVKAVVSFASAGPIGNPEGWLFRIAHNTALDFLRRRNRQEALRSGEEVEMMADPPTQSNHARPRRLPCEPSCGCRWRNARASF
jgi:RNA polymerase sigma-70 factor (ECF subfamily)